MGAPYFNQARGITALLGLRDMGGQPRELAEQLALVLDGTLPFLLNLRERVNLGTVVAPAVGENYPAGSVVPAGELWAVWCLQTQITPGAATAIELASCVNEQGFGYRIGDYLAVAALNEGRAVNFQAYQNVTYLAAGTQLGFQVRNITGAPGTAFVTALISRLRI